jgi:integrase
MTQTKARKTKGSIGVESVQGRLRLRLPRSLSQEVFKVKQKYVPLGLDDTPQNRKLAEAKAKDMESDITYERFDITFAKYLPQYATVEEEVSPLEKVKLSELWSKFVEYKRPQCSPSTMKNQYGQLTRYVQQLPTQNLSHAPQIRDWCIANIPVESCKRLLTRLSACCEWAMKSGVIPEDPFNGMSKEIKRPKGEKADTDIDPFDAEERDAILKALETNQFCSKYSRVKHSFYYPYVHFLFFTGCRTSEAVGLTWDCIEDDFSFITFKQAAVKTEKGIQTKRGLKTQDSRVFPCNAQMREFLASIKPENAKPSDLVFPSPKGKFIDSGNFRERVWEKVLEGLKLKYRKPYQTRHTFITLCLKAGMSVQDVAKLVGNSPKMIYEHYAGKSRVIQVPEL